MFGLDPLSRPVAIAEMLLLLTVAAFIGWLLGRLSRRGRVKALRLALTDRAAGRDISHQLIVPTQADETLIPLITADPLAPVYGTPILAIPDVDIETEQPELPATPPPVEIPPLGAPIPESPPSFPPQSAPTDHTETAVLSRIAARSGELNFDRIGRAMPTDADDLKDVVGIGPFLERKLHSLGIYTFRQISNFAKEDCKQVNEIIEFFPGRIDRDDWVGQAKTLHERKYGV
jgi:predicted flap endonuclease-1-like 5' DNA nuclease